MHSPTHLPNPAAAAKSRLVCLLAALLFATGCPGPEPPAANPAPSITGATVELSAPQELQLQEQWQLQLAEWSAATGGAFDWHETASADVPAAPPDATLAVVPLRSIPALIASDWIAAIAETDPSIGDWDDVLRGLRNGIGQPGGEPHVIPVACPVLACYFRADLLEAAGRRPPETWEEYQTLLDELAEWSGGLPALEPWSPEFRSTMFLARAASAALHPDNVSILLDLQSAQPLIGRPPFVEALSGSLAALKRLDVRSLEIGPAECVQAVLEGKAALAIGTPPDSVTDVPREAGAVIGTFRLPGAMRVYESTSATWTTLEGEPSRVVIAGFGGYAVCASRAADPAARTAAWSLWDSVQRNTPEGDLPFGPAVCRQRDMAAALQHPRAGFLASEWRQHIESTASALQSTRVLLDFPLPESARFRQLLSARLDDAIAGSQAPEAALQQAADDWKALIAELGDRRVLNVYRQSHGLSPR